MDLIETKESEVNSCSRREFLKSSSYAGVILSISAYGFTSAEGLFSPSFQNTPIGSGFNIFSIAVIDDSATLAMKSQNLSPVIQKCLVSNFDLAKKGSNDPHPGNTARLAGLLPFNKSDFISLLANAKENKEKLNDFGEETQKLGFALGWIANKAGEKHLSQFKAGDKSISESSVYCDATILRSKSNGKSKSVKAEDIQSLLHQMAPRIFTRFHTFIPDFDDGEGWILRMAEWRNNLNKYFDDLAKAYANPDPEKEKKYITGPGFFNPEDKAIQLVHFNEAKGGIKFSDIEQVIKAEAKSKYAKAIIQGYKNIKLANDFLEGKFNENQLQEELKS